MKVKQLGVLSVTIWRSLNHPKGKAIYLKADVTSFADATVTAVTVKTDPMRETVLPVLQVHFSVTTKTASI